MRLGNHDLAHLGIVALQQESVFPLGGIRTREQAKVSSSSGLSRWAAFHRLKAGFRAAFAVFRLGEWPDRFAG
jgi:hypothetical protein